MDAKGAERKIISFISGYFRKAKRKTAVVGLSGGLDSAATLALCVRALGRKNVLAVLLPSASTPARDIHDANEFAKGLGAFRVKFPIQMLIHSFGYFSTGRLDRANVSARVRMAVLYAIASKHNGLVVGTGDRSEFLLGYFTKHGDGGADLFPLGGLYKTQVKALAKYLGIPKAITEKPPSPALWKGHSAEAELGFSYEEADKILSAIEKGAKRSKLAKKFKMKTLSALFARMERNRHKLLPAPICGLYS